MVIRTLILTLLSILPLHIHAAEAPHDTSTSIEDPAFHTLRVMVNDQEFTPPVIYLNSDDRLNISFDELSDDLRYMRYELLHCTADWRIDNLIPAEYLDGFNEAPITDYSYSQATLTHYIHYSLTIPNEEMRPTISGNYLLRIYDENDPDRTLLQVRFCIVEPTMKVKASVTSRTDIDYNESHQQLSVSVDPDGTYIANPYTDISVRVEQNSRCDNAVSVTGPTSMEGTLLKFDHDRRLIFPAGNEFRRMEVVSTTYPGMGVESISFADPYYHFDLYPDSPRLDSPYTYDQTQFGGFKIREYNSTDSDVEADYVIVHFSLMMPWQDSFDIFIDGDLTHHRFDPQSRMVFNRATNRYESAMLLKQGAYNYQYLAVPVGSMTGLTAPIEGDKYQTANRYLVKVYQRRPGERYDRLTAVTMATSGI